MDNETLITLPHLSTTQMWLPHLHTPVSLSCCQVGRTLAELGMPPSLVQLEFD